MRASLFAASLCATGCSTVVDLRGEGALHVSYIIAGGAAHPDGRAPATGGAAIMPAARLLLSSQVADPYVAAAPAIVAPQSLKSMGFVGAFDAGIGWHPPTRAWHVGTAVTVAPSFMRFCNALWCLREWVLLYGGEAHFGGALVRTEGGGGLTANLAVRVLTGRPTAWFWPQLSPGDRDVNHWLAAVGGAATWRF